MRRTGSSLGEPKATLQRTTRVRCIDPCFKTHTDMQTSTPGCVSVSEHTQMFNGGLSEKAVESGSSQPEHAPVSLYPLGLLDFFFPSNAFVGSCWVTLSHFYLNY